MKSKTSIVVCAYNEETTIENIVRKISEFNTECELIVVDDGSADKTNSILKSLRKQIEFNLITFPENKGKSYAMVEGVKAAKREIIMFFDADVTGIRKEHFEMLLEPLKGEADMVLGSPSETLIDYRINPFKSLTGERAIYKKDLEPILENIRDIRFGVETYMNLYFQAHGKKIKYILLDGLEHPTKYKKTSTTQATSEFMSEGKEIATTLMSNYDLILKRINNSFEEQSDNFKDTFKSIQKEIDDKFLSILKKEK